MEKSEVFTNPTISEEHYTLLKDNLGQINNKVRLSSSEVAGIVETIRSTRAYEYEGYKTLEFGKYAEEVLGYKKGAISQMHSVATMFGVTSKDGVITIDSRVADYGVEKLYRISRHPALQAIGDEQDPVVVFKTVCENLDIHPDTRLADVKDLIAIASGKTTPEEKSEKSTPDNSSVDQTEKSTSDNGSVDRTETTETSAEPTVDYKKFVEQWLHYAEDKKMKDDEFRKAFIKAVKELA